MRTLKIKKMLAKIVHNYDVKNSNIGKVYVKPIQRYQNHFYETIVYILTHFIVNFIINNHCAIKLN